MTLALTQSIIDSNGTYNHEQSIKYYIHWMRKGRFSTTDYAWDMGISTREALTIWKDKDSSDDTAKTQRQVNALLGRDDKSGNGSLMRIAPIGVALWKDAKFARKVARAQSQITHPAIACVEACDVFTEVVCRVMRGESDVVFEV